MYSGPKRRLAATKSSKVPRKVSTKIAESSAKCRAPRAARAAVCVTDAVIIVISFRCFSSLVSQTPERCECFSSHLLLQMQGVLLSHFRSVADALQERGMGLEGDTDVHIQGAGLHQHVYNVEIRCIEHVAQDETTTQTCLP